MSGWAGRRRTPLRWRHKSDRPNKVQMKAAARRYKMLGPAFLCTVLYSNKTGLFVATEPSGSQAGALLIWQIIAVWCGAQMFFDNTTLYCVVYAIALSM